jgi:hypothetical protein
MKKHLRKLATEKKTKRLSRTKKRPRTKRSLTQMC